MAPKDTEIRLLLVDDHPAVREGLAHLLSAEGFVVAGEAGAHAEALARAEQCAPALALVDLSLGGEDGLSLVTELRLRNLPAVIYSMHDDADHVEAAFEAGARGYVSKREPYEVLAQALREVAGGGRFVSPRAALALAERIADRRTRTPERPLSEQERKVYRLLGEGEGTAEIAAALRISAKTVESYYARLQSKLGLEGMRDLRRHAIAHHAGPPSR